LANVLKVLERIFLRLIGARDTVAATPQHPATKTRKTEPKDSKEAKGDELERGAQRIHRS
jgi:hypothetical protein